MRDDQYEIVWNNEDTFSSDHTEVSCPYCGNENDLSGHEEAVWQDDQAFVTWCGRCEKPFSVIPSMSFTYSAYQIEVKEAA